MDGTATNTGVRRLANGASRLALMAAVAAAAALHAMGPAKADVTVPANGPYQSCPDMSPGLTMSNANYALTAYTDTWNLWQSGSGLTYVAQDGQYGTITNPQDGLSYAYSDSPFFMATWRGNDGNAAHRETRWYQGSHAPQFMFSTTPATAGGTYGNANGQTGAIVVWDNDNVLRVLSKSEQVPEFDAPGYRNNAYSYKGPQAFICDFTVEGDPSSDKAPGFDGDYAENNGVYVSDGHRYSSNKLVPVGDGVMGTDERSTSVLSDAWAGAVAQANWGIVYTNPNGSTTTFYAEPGATPANDYWQPNYPPTPPMLANVVADYKAANIDLSALPSRLMYWAFKYMCSDVVLGSTQYYTSRPQTGPFSGGTYTYTAPYGGFYQGSTTLSFAHTDPNIQLRDYASTPQINEYGTSLVWTVDGTGTYLCDPAQIASNPMIARAPLAFNGVYCAALASANPPGYVAPAPAQPTPAQPAPAPSSGSSSSDPSSGTTTSTSNSSSSSTTTSSTTSTGTTPAPTNNGQDTGTASAGTGGQSTEGAVPNVDPTTGQPVVTPPTTMSVDAPTLTPGVGHAHMVRQTPGIRGLENGYSNSYQVNGDSSGAINIGQ